MPNFIGGKNYKKTKHVSEAAAFVEKEDDQLYGRVIQVLGNRNTLVFCNDNIVRLCHIRGSIRKDMWISIGDIVIVSVRDFLRDKNDKYEKGDILFRYDREHYSKLKKEVGINTKLFLPIETGDSDTLRRMKELRVDTTRNLFETNDDIVFDNGDNDSDVDIDAL